MTKEEVNKAIGSRIAVLREKRELSANRLGILVGASGPMVKAWEEGASPNLYYFMRLCSALDTTPTYLLTGRKR